MVPLLVNHLSNRRKSDFSRPPLFSIQRFTLLDNNTWQTICKPQTTMIMDIAGVRPET